MRKNYDDSNKGVPRGPLKASRILPDMIVRLEANGLKTAGKIALVVLGMHRSGTSAVTGALNCVGIQLGSRLYSGHKGINDKGYFENSDIADLDDEVLLTLGSYWDDILPLPEASWVRPDLKKYSARLGDLIQRDFKNAELWGIKDPRVCKLLPWWKQVISEHEIAANFLIVVRHPMEVALSLQKRDHFSLEKSLILWVEYNLQAELNTRENNRTVLLYDDFLSQPAQELERVEQTLGITFPIPIEDAAPSINDFLSEGLRHHKQVSLSESSTIERISQDIYECLCKLENGRRPGKSQIRLDELRHEFDEYRQCWPEFIMKHLEDVTRERAAYRMLWKKVSRSISWFIGKPVRYLERLLNRDV